MAREKATPCSRMGEGMQNDDTKKLIEFESDGRVEDGSMDALKDGSMEGLTVDPKRRHGEQTGERH